MFFLLISGINSFNFESIPENFLDVLLSLLKLINPDVKSLIIGALLTTVVFLSTGWQSGVQKVEIVQGFGKTLKVELKDGGDRFNPLYVKEVK